MSSYLVTWEINVDDVANPVEAAFEARAAQTEPGSAAVVFSVTDLETGQVTTVDLEEWDA